MTRRLVAVLLLVLSAGSVHAAQSEKQQYAEALGNIVIHAIQPELAKHPELLSGTAKFAFQVDAKGRVSHIAVNSSTHNRFIEETILRGLRTLKLKPPPPRVLADSPGKFVDYESEWTFAGPN